MRKSLPPPAGNKMVAPLTVLGIPIFLRKVSASREVPCVGRCVLPGWNHRDRCTTRGHLQFLIGWLFWEATAAGFYDESGPVNWSSPS